MKVTKCVFVFMYACMGARSDPDSPVQWDTVLTKAHRGKNAHTHSGGRTAGRVKGEEGVLVKEGL